MIFYLGRKYSDEGLIERIFRILTIGQIVDLILTAQQYFVMGLHPDYCNGIFGFTEQNNGQQGFFCLLMCIVPLAKYVMKKMNIKRLAFYFGMSSVICAISEIKAFFVMLLMVCLAGFFFELNSWKKLKKLFKVMVIGVSALALGYFLLSLYMPDNLYTFFNIEAYLKYEAYAQNRSGIGRLNQVSYIYNYEFSNNLLFALIGKGVGQEWSKYAYDFGKVFMQTGFVGVFLFYGFLILDFANAFLSRKKEVGLIVSLAVVVTIIASINWYCILNRNCYIVFFFLSLIPCSGRNNSTQLSYLNTENQDVISQTNYIV